VNKREREGKKMQKEGLANPKNEKGVVEPTPQTVGLIRYYPHKLWG
jgi:hypothetical protein